MSNANSTIVPSKNYTPWSVVGVNGFNWISADSADVRFQLSSNSNAPQLRVATDRVEVDGVYLQCVNETDGNSVKLHALGAATPGVDVNGSQVLGQRATGWTVPTGTLNRLSFDQGTVTLPQLAQRVAALITDLMTAHGMIGA